MHTPIPEDDPSRHFCDALDTAIRIGHDTVAAIAGRPPGRALGCVISRGRMARAAARHLGPSLWDDRVLLGDVDGVALAGATITADGTVLGSFNRLGGAASVDKFGTGSYSVELPNHAPDWDTTVVAVTPAQSGYSCAWQLDAPAAVDVHCWNSSTGDVADTGFSVLVY